MEVDLFAGSREVRLHQRVVEETSQTLQDEVEILRHKHQDESRVGPS